MLCAIFNSSTALSQTERVGISKLNFQKFQMKCAEIDKPQTRGCPSRSTEIVEQMLEYLHPAGTLTAIGRVTNRVQRIVWIGQDGECIGGIVKWFTIECGVASVRVDMSNSKTKVVFTGKRKWKKDQIDQ
ncbi:unnamed protein product [Soboliphyme baturini]|uniref:Uncharacterized protein n=1 Tax=Soboliphyme baturini TaxID=241478 RepID=A0A183J0Y2_9BILA|nr:unnamed protein product [Soboliphyme baturini]